MRLIKIGRSPANDIVINSDFVGSHHADITILDSGEILIEDKGSKNGTFVGPDKKRIKPGEEVQIRRGDLVKIADVDLPWAKVPTLTRNTNYKQLQNIGSNFRNDIVVNDSSVSRYHATVKKDQSNKVFIEDNGSTNGTEVNGVKIRPHQAVRIKRGDNVVVGTQNITPQLAPMFPKSKAWIPYTFGAACLAAAIVFLVLFLVKNHQAGVMPKDAVAHVSHMYHYKISPKNNPYDLPLTFEEEEPSVIQGTAFFIDDNGRMGTCMHVVEPWREEFNPEKIKELRKDWQNYLSSKLPRQVTSLEELHQLLSSPIGDYISKKGNSLAEVNAMLNTIFTSDLNIEGVTDELLVAYPGRMYSSARELDPASIVAKSDNPNADVAIIQLNTKQTPAKAAKVHFDLNKSYKKNPEVKETFTTIGFPNGIGRALDFETLSMEPYIRESKVAKVPSKYYFELADDGAGGESGSPVFNEKNELAGVLNAAYNGNAKTVEVIHAQYLKDLYDKEVKE
ncbi:MAG: FHA domain-containing protein [Muribaculaceae bacterium]|nr:FHA domain-containing protein [Muribaculaceae bacterium]